MIEDVLLSEFVHFSRVCDESLVLEGRLIGERLSHVEEVADDSSISLPCVDSRLKKDGCCKVDLSRIVRVIGTVLNWWIVDIGSIAVIVVVIVIAIAVIVIIVVP